VGHGDPGRVPAEPGGAGTGGPGAVPWQPVVAAVVLAALRLRVRIRVFGRLPSRAQPLLVLANHQHDLDSVVVPALAMLTPPWGVPVRALASQRLFEPGFLAPRLPRLWRTVLRDPAFARLLSAFGVLPVENEPLARSLASLAAEVAARHGDLPLGEVLSAAALARLGTEAAAGRGDPPATGASPAAADPCGPAPRGPRPRAGTAARDLRLHHLWSPPLVALRPQPASLLALREPYRGEVRRAVRDRLQAQLAAAEDALGRGETVFLTPEGRITADGRLARMREALGRLVPRAHGRVYLAAISYDPFRRRRMTMLCRLVPPAAPEDLSASLAAARPVTVSQLLASWLAAGGPPSFGADEAAAAVRAGLDALPPAVWTPPELRSAPDAEVAAALAAMVGCGWLSVARGRFRRTAVRTDRHLHEAEDIFAHQANQMAETAAAAARLG
jgi:1-acyl-sn-glycerol-3-phosphate acyltransferase